MVNTLSGVGPWMKGEIIRLGLVGRLEEAVTLRANPDILV